MLAPFDGPGRNRFGMVSCGEKGVSMGKPRPKAARAERFSTLGIPRTVLSLHSLMYRPKSAWGGRGVYYGSATPLRIAHMRRTVIGVSIEDETKKKLILLKLCDIDNVPSIQLLLLMLLTNR